MAKKKKRKDEQKEKKKYSIELTGLLLILIAVIGFGRFGIVGKAISNFSSFLVGTWYNVLLGIIAVLGMIMMIKREKIKFFTSKTVGLYLICIGVLTFSHSSYIEQNKLQLMDILRETINNFMASTTVINNIEGGGVLGALFSVLFVKLFDIEGTKIVIWTLIVCGFIMFTGFSIYDLVKWSGDKVKSKLHLKKGLKDEKEVEAAASNYEKDNKIVISSVDELMKHEEKVDEIVTPVVEEDINNDEPINLVYHYPPLNLLKKPPKINTEANQVTIKDNVKILETVFHDFEIDGKVVSVHIGPAVTQYEMELKAGTKLNKVLSINKEIALALAAKDVRIEAPIPGKNTIGVEIPNKAIAMVTIREILELVPKNNDNKLLVTLGRDIMGNPIFCEINKTPHLLVAGATGSGKSICINSMIVSILMRAKPDEVKLILVDPKKVELSVYNGAPHLLAPVVTDPKKANIALKKICVEMERRYELFSETGTKNIAGYNTYVEKKNATLPDGEKLRKIPFIVVIIDELADLMLVAAKEVEDSIMRITQMARAAGIHLIVATQRPSTDIITGVVKANIPSRISFAVSSSIDSRTILDMTGAEKLLGKGDMLFLPMGENTPLRVQGTYISEEEIKAVVDYTISQQKAHYDNTLLMDEEEMGATTMVDEHDATEEPLYNEIVEFVITQGKASASLLQRRFRLGYNRAARAIDLLEERGIVGPSNGSKPREVLVKLDKKDED